MTEEEATLRELVADILKDLGVPEACERLNTNPPHTNDAAIKAYWKAYEDLWQRMLHLEPLDGGGEEDRAETAR